MNSILLAPCISAAQADDDDLHEPELLLTVKRAASRYGLTPRQIYDLRDHHGLHLICQGSDDLLVNELELILVLRTGRTTLWDALQVPVELLKEDAAFKLRRSTSQKLTELSEIAHEEPGQMDPLDLRRAPGGDLYRIDGSARAAIAVELGWKTVPCFVWPCSLGAAVALAVRLNRARQQGLKRNEIKAAVHRILDYWPQTDLLLREGKITLRRLAEHCKVSKDTIQRVRDERKSGITTDCDEEKPTIQNIPEKPSAETVTRVITEMAAVAEIARGRPELNEGDVRRLARSWLDQTQLLSAQLGVPATRLKGAISKLLKTPAQAALSGLSP